MKHAVLFTCILFLGACAGTAKQAVRQDNYLQAVTSQNAALAERVRKLESDVVMLGMVVNANDRLKGEFLRGLKMLYFQLKEVRHELLNMNVGYAQLDKDISVLWDKVLRFHGKLKNKEEQRSSGSEIILEPKRK